MAEAAAHKARTPLCEATNRINSSSYPAPVTHSSKSRYRTTSKRQSKTQQVVTNENKHPEAYGRTSAPRKAQSSATSPVVSAPYSPVDDDDDDKRLSQASYETTSSSRSRKSYKTHIGPWQLGRTLGKGSSARVRLCRHNVTHQLAAVKIVNRRMAYLVQDSSLAALTQHDSSIPQTNGEMRVPMSIEREVAILKLIEHPNIMKLYDIWENRSEIYLILEYVDQGDLFTFINTKGRLSEEIAIFFFRQIISAIAYCHSFNICHRDLKPENILITSDLQIKIADFGMAALHQTNTHRLATACGSPHYAAPELLKNRQYRGDKADIWSLGVILYAMLSATLPFDDPDLRVMMGKTKKGQYEMPEFLSPEAEDLIRRMLQVNPNRRITLKEIWDHPLVQKYSYLDEFSDITSQLPRTLQGFQYTAVPRDQLDPQLLRQLRSMWHMFSEQQLALKLTNDEPNDQKAFYWLLHNYREKQLEDFKPELSPSMSDYHHLKPAIWKKRVSTCQFSQPRGNGHGRSFSRFTVISTAAETETGTIKSYDPYRSSRVLHTSGSKVSHAKITVHRNASVTSAAQSSHSSRRRASSNVARRRTSSVAPSGVSQPHSSRGSLSSLHRPGASHGHGPILRHKRGVDFSHVRKRSVSVAQTQRSRRSVASSVAGDGPYDRPQSPTPDLPTLPNGTRAKAVRGSASQDASLMFNEELRRFSSTIARDCDEAFRSSLIEVESGSVTDMEGRYRDSTPFSLTIDTPSDATAPTEFSSKSWSSRPLPPLPSEDGIRSPTTADTSLVVSSDDECCEEVCEIQPLRTQRLAVPMMLPVPAERRAVSAPVYSHASKRPMTLPSINENSGGMIGVAEKSRIFSAPPHASPKKTHAGAEYLSQVETSIRVVDSPGQLSPVKIPKPLNLRKKSTKSDIGRALHRQLAYNAEDGDDELEQDRLKHEVSGTVKKKKSWFKLPFKNDTNTDVANKESHGQKSRTVSGETQQSNAESSVTTHSKRKTFSFPFWKSNRNRHSKMMIDDGEEDTGRVSTKPTIVRPGLHESLSGGSRNIEVKQSWLARLFRVKPATSYICMATSRKQARQEVALLLREWRKYGIRGVQVDKQRNIVFARIGAENFLNLREVAFAAEVMTVIEHGRKQPLSIIRFTQESGAASSFHKVVDTINMVFASRNLVVAERSKQKMMIKTLNS